MLPNLVNSTCAGLDQKAEPNGQTSCVLDRSSDHYPDMPIRKTALQASLSRPCFSKTTSSPRSRTSVPLQAATLSSHAA